MTLGQACPRHLREAPDPNVAQRGADARASQSLEAVNSEVSVSEGVLAPRALGVL